MSSFKQANSPIITAHSHVTLHYRLTVLDDVLSDFLNTFDASPATVAIGQAQLAPFMEARLIGLAEGAHEVFDLTCEQAFGEYNESLKREVSRELLLEGNPHVDSFGQGDFVEFAMPNDYKMSGVFLGWNLMRTGAWVDFNHPLAGKSLRMEVQIIGVL
jgi:FKBP-type peptidyl-prolyl cis-trans isomerase SlpA